MTNATSVQSGIVSYRWQFSKDSGITFTDLSNNISSPTLSISNAVAEQNNYLYRVVASSGGLTTISNPAKLLVFPEINITSQPQNQETSSNSALFNFSYTASSGASNTINWEYSDFSDADTFFPIPEATGNSLVLNNLSALDDGKFYRAKITSKFSNTYPRIIYTNKAQLDYIIPNITITQQPKDCFLYSGSQPILFSVSVTSTNDITYQWEESADGINFTSIVDANDSILYGASVSDVLDKNQYKYRVVLSSNDYTIYSSVATLHTAIELPVIDNIYNNTYLWGDPHLRIQSTKGAIATLDDNSNKDAIVYFYVKYPNGDSYKVVYENTYSSPTSNNGPTAIKDIYVIYNGKKIYGTSSTTNQSIITPFTDTILNKCVFAGVTGWDYQKGKCLSLSTTAGLTNLDNTNYIQLIKNSVKWLCKNKSNPSILILSSNNAAQDIKMSTTLTSLTNKTINIVSLSTFNNSDNILSSTDVVVLQNNYNWNTSTISNVGQNALKSFVCSGGGLLTAEWVIWNMAVGKLKILADIVPVVPTSSYTTKSPIRYIRNINDSILNAGVSNDFTFNSTNIAGTETAIVSVKSGATIFYYSEQCIDSSSDKILNIGDILSIVYKSPGNFNNMPYYNVYTKWNNIIQYNDSIIIGGALYWTLKSLIEHQKDPNNLTYKMWKSNLSGPRVDGYGMVMKPYNITRQMLSDAVNAVDGSDQINNITESITMGNNFWKNLSKTLRGLKPNDNYYIKNIVYFTKHPGNRTIDVNTPVSMDAKASSTSNETIVYGWQVSSNNRDYSNLRDGTLYSGTKTNTLNILKPSLTDSGKTYRLSISSNAASIKYSNPSTLTVVPSINVISYPTEQNAEDGLATFSIEATSTSGKLTYQWQKSSSKTSGYTNVAGATSKDLLVSVSSYLQNNTYYRVIIKNNSYSITTNGVKLIAIPVISIFQQPQNYSSDSGKARFDVGVTISSPLSAPPATTYEWQVSANNRNYTKIANSNTSILSLSNLTQNNNGFYYRVLIKTPKSQIISKPARLTIEPSIFANAIYSNANYTTSNNIEYASITMTVGASSSIGVLSYQWQQSKDGGKTYSNLPNTNYNRITVNNITKKHYQYYKYRVLISNSIETITVYQNG